MTRAVAPVALAFGLAGCVTESASGDTAVFRFALWVFGLSLLGAAVLGLAGHRLRTRSARYGWALMLFAGLLGLLLAPNLLSDRATVDRGGFTLRTSFWFAPRRYDVRFADLAQLRVVSSERQTRRGRRTEVNLFCYRRSGGLTIVPAGDLMQRGPVEKILAIAEEQKIPVSID